MAERHRLWVVESNGTPRSGKGTITEGLTNKFPGSAQDETGADYRAVTFGLINDRVLDPEMSEGAVEKVVTRLSQAEIAHYAAERYEIVAEYGNDSLYTEEINGIVGLVSPHKVVRGAVKKGFAKRVSRHVADTEVRMLFVDGRNLSPVIRTVKGAEILLRQFIDCQPQVAAQREAARKDVDLKDPDNTEWFLRTLRDIRSRQMKDEHRITDPVRPDKNAIKYWSNSGVLAETTQRLALLHRMPFAEASTIITADADGFRRDGRRGVGAKAVVQRRQVYFDTSETTKDSMLEFAKRMVEEALEESAGIYRPLCDELIST